MPDDDLKDLSERIRIAASGDRSALGPLLDGQRDRLRAMVSFRMDRRLRQRVDPSDVVQEAFIDAIRRVDEFIASGSLPFFVWLRLLTKQKIATLHRHHLGREARDAEREVALDGEYDDTSTALAARLADQRTDPGDAVVRQETQRRLHETLQGMDPIDREVLALRHFEELSNVEAAAVLDIQPAAASKRYVRALERLRELLASLQSGE